MKRINLILSAFLIVVTLLLVRSTGVEAATAAKCTWKTVNGVNQGSNDNLMGVSATSTNDVWVVGAYTNSSNHRRAQIEHWNGTAWSKVASPTIGTDSYLNAVSVDAANDVWAVGEYENASFVYFTLIEHWNGTAWSIVASPSPGTSFNVLSGVVALATNNVWAVGIFYGTTIGQTLIERWNGTQWSVVSSPNPGVNGNGLNGIAASSANKIWAVGEQTNNSNVTQTLIEQWNGTQWSVVSSPNPGTGGGFLFGVTSLSSSNAWAVGGGNGLTQTLVEHWNGTQWSIVSSPTAPPNSGGSVTDLAGIAAVSGNDLWAVGTNSLGSIPVSIIEHWNGTKWSLVTHPNPGTAFNGLIAITVVPGSSNLWTVGSYDNTGGTNKVLIETHC